MLWNDLKQDENGYDYQSDGNQDYYYPDDYDYNYGTKNFEKSYVETVGNFPNVYKKSKIHLTRCNKT